MSRPKMHLFAVAKKSISLRANVSAIFHKKTVNISLVAAVDKLMESDFHKKIEKGRDTPIIADRDTAIAML